MRRRLKYRLFCLKVDVLMTECPCCHGYCGHYAWDEPPEDCGYCKNEGLVSHYKAWEWKLIEKGHLPPSDWLPYLWGRIIYKDCPEPNDMHLGCKVCEGRGIVRRFGRGHSS